MSMSETSGSVETPPLWPWSVADGWFEALDGECLQVGDEQWSARVLGIHQDGADLWIQLGDARRSGRSVLLCIGPFATARDVRNALRVTARRSRARVIHVARAA
jgi:hypothetical protein